MHKHTEASAIPLHNHTVICMGGPPLLTEGTDFDRFLSASWVLEGSGENWRFLAGMMRF